jgi:hypothetical protein
MSGDGMRHPTDALAEYAAGVLDPPEQATAGRPLRCGVAARGAAVGAPVGVGGVDPGDGVCRGGGCGGWTRHRRDRAVAGRAADRGRRCRRGIRAGAGAGVRGAGDHIDRRSGRPAQGPWQRRSRWRRRPSRSAGALAAREVAGTARSHGEPEGEPSTGRTLLPGMRPMSLWRHEVHRAGWAALVTPLAATAPACSATGTRLARRYGWSTPSVGSPRCCR